MDRIMDKFSLAGKTALVTGGCYGIGFAIATALHSAGARVVFCATSDASVEKALKAYEAEGITDVKGYACDVTNEEKVKALIAGIEKDVAPLDILVNNAGIIKRIPMCDMDVEDFRRVVDVDLVAPFIVSKAVLPGMVERGRGHVINMGSIAGDYAYPGGSVYCACKAAVKALSDGLRIDLVDTPIRVTNVKPGLVETNFSVVRFRGDKATADNVYEGLRPLTGDDVAEVVYFAASLPEHIQIAEVLVMPTNQATGTIAYRKK